MGPAQPLLLLVPGGATVNDFDYQYHHETEQCPRCRHSMLGESIPQRNRELYGGKTHFSRVIGVEVPGVYDGVLYWKCPDCDHKWHRFPESDWRHQRAIGYVLAVSS